MSPQARAALSSLEGLVAPRTQGGATQGGRREGGAACSAGGGGESVAATSGAVASGAAVSHAVLSVLGDLVTEIAISGDLVTEIATSTLDVSLETCEIAPSSDATGRSSPAGSGTSGGGAALQRRRSSGDIAPLMLAAEVFFCLFFWSHMHGMLVAYAWHAHRSRMVGTGAHWSTHRVGR